jgi:hypothetical protein
MAQVPIQFNEVLNVSVVGLYLFIVVHTYLFYPSFANFAMLYLFNPSCACI